MRSDALFFRLFEARPETFFLLLGLAAEMAAKYVFLALEFKETATRADGVFRPLEPGEPIYFLEVQFYRKPTVYADLLVKIAHYLKHHDPAQPWRGVVLFARRSLDLSPEERVPYQPLLDAGYIKAIYLDELEDRPGSPLGMSILGLIREHDTTVGAKAKPLIARVKAEIGDEGARREMVELVETVVMYKLSELTREEIQTMLEVDDIRETRVYKDAKLEGKQEGLTEGKREGLTVGKREGRMEEKLEALKKMHAKKFSAEMIAEILAVDADFVQQEIDRMQRDKL